MFFWLLVVGVIIASIIIVIKTDDIFLAVLGIVIAAAVGFSVLATAAAIEDGVNKDSGNNVLTETHPLRSIGGGDTVEGQYYIAGQIIDDERYITYMSSEKNSDEENIVSIKEVPADNSKIVEEEIDKPYVEVITSERSVPWLFTWNISNAPTYKFYVPKNSVIADASFIKENKEAKDW